MDAQEDSLTSGGIAIEVLDYTRITPDDTLITVKNISNTTGVF